MSYLKFFVVLLAAIVLINPSLAEAGSRKKKKPKAPLVSSLAVFPGAIGYGSRTVAGSGRHLKSPSTKIYKVTNLSDSGKGSLRECIDGSNPRVCIFEIAGRIALKKDLKVTKPYLTIAGQTAPAPGILITGAGLRIESHDVLVQHIEVRVGDAKAGPNFGTRDGVAVTATKVPVYNVVFDHGSISWAMDENFSTWYPNTNDVTISNSIVSEALHRSAHPDAPHSMGMLIGDHSQRISIHHNLLAHNHDRNPRMKPGTQVEFINNVVYNWGGSSSWNQANLSDTEKTGVPTYFNFIGNYYKRGPQSPDGGSIYAKPPASGSRVFALGNIGPKRLSDIGSEWSISHLQEVPYRSLVPAFPLSGILPMAPEQTYEHVLTHAGSRPKEANAVDKRIVIEVRLGAGSIKDCIEGCSNAVGSWPSPPTVARTLNPPKKPNSDDNRDGYTNLENWLHALAAQLE